MIAANSSNSDSVEGNVPQTAEQAVRAFIEKKGLTYSQCDDKVAPGAFQAYGVRHLDDNVAWAMRVRAVPAPYGNGFDFNATTLMCDGGGDWEWVQRVCIADGKFLSTNPRWTTSNSVEARNMTPGLDENYLDALDYTLAEKQRLHKTTTAAKAVAADMCEQYGADEKGNVYLPQGGNCRLSSNAGNAYAAFEFVLTDPEKIAAVMAIVNGSTPALAPAEAVPARRMSM